MSIAPPSLFLRITALLAFAGLSPSVSSQAALLVYEGFTGYTAGQLGGQKPNANTIGLDTAVGYYDGAGTRTAGYTLETTGLTLGSLATGGGALKFTAGTNVIGADIDIGATAFTGTLWSSYLVKLTTRSTAAFGDGTVIRIGNSPGDSTNGHFNSWADSRTSSVKSENVAVGYSNANPTSSNGSGPLALNTTYIILNRFTNVGNAAGGTATLWALTETQFTAFLAADGEESDLTPGSYTATATTDTVTGSYIFSSTQAVGIVSVATTGIFDELRFGSDLASVIPTAIPEPAATAIWIGLGCATACGCRRPGPRRHTQA